MKKLTSIIFPVILIMIFSACGKKEKIDASKAPEEIKNAVELSYQMSKELTDIQVQAGKDKVLDAAEIEAIGKAFKKLAIVNNSNVEKYVTNKYFLAVKKEYKDKFDELAEQVVFLKDCKGYDELGLAIQKIALDVKDVTDLP